MKLVSIAVAAAMLFASGSASRAEISEITIAQQFGVSFLPLMLMERDSQDDDSRGSAPRSAPVDRTDAAGTRAR